MKCSLVCILALAVVIGGCGGKKTIAVTPPALKTRPLPEPAPPVGTEERGMASWYGHPYHGRPAADGEIYDMEKMVAAHRTLPFQTMVRVRNLTNDKTVDVRIIDRGPFIANRIIDLSHAAARAIDLIGPGVANVELTIISNTAPTAANVPVAVSTPAVIAADDNAQFAVQVGAFRDRANAERMQQQMAA